MNAYPFMISARDDSLIGASASRDPLGLLPVWSARGRDLVPHLTEQTTRAEGFELQISTFWLWRRFVTDRPEHSAELRAFYLIIEQAFAHAATRVNGEWPLPGQRRVNAVRGDSSVELSLGDRSCHLIRNQLGNGTWGLYRGAAARARLLDGRAQFLDHEIAELLDGLPPFDERVARQLCRVVDQVFEAPGEAHDFSLNKGSQIVQRLAALIKDVPHQALLWDRIVNSHPLTRSLTDRLLALPGEIEGSGYRAFLVQASGDLPDHRDTLQDVLRCEGLLAPTEGVFRWLCRQAGSTVATAGAGLPVDLPALQDAQRAFRQSGTYQRGGARERWRLYANELDTSSATELIESLLRIHQRISEQRRRAPWIEVDETGRLVSNVEVEAEDATQLDPSRGWRHSYYLRALGAVARQMAERRGL